jgi:hypothetical protein
LITLISSDPTLYHKRAQGSSALCAVSDCEQQHSAHWYVQTFRTNRAVCDSVWAVSQKEFNIAMETKVDMMKHLGVCVKMVRMVRDFVRTV